MVNLNVWDIGLIGTAVSVVWALIKNKKFVDKLIIIFFIVLVLKLIFGN